MTRINTDRFIRVLLLFLLLTITPMLVLGDVHLKHENSDVISEDHYSAEHKLPWHPHGACASDIESEHFDLKSLIQKSHNIEIYQLPQLSSTILGHDHRKCQYSSQVVGDTESFQTEDILKSLNILLI